MSNNKILTVIGTRPQYIKAAPVSREIRKYFHEVLVDTGQHYDYNMSGVFFEELHIPKPDYNLGVGSASHGKQTGEMLIRLEEVVLQEKPDAVLVYGDTNSTLAGALVASKMHLPLFHVEAGLRSFNKLMPEEINRIMTDHVSTLLFAPTETAIENLKREGITERVYNVGDVMYDAVQYNVKIAEETRDLSQYGVSPGQFFLATIHRAENTDDAGQLQRILEALLELNKIVIVPLHPRTKNKLQGLDVANYLKNSTNVKIVDPVSYLDMLLLEWNAKGIITDSGGVQKEAYFARKPCFTIRQQTEWVETVKVGWNVLVDLRTMNLKELIEHKLSDMPPYISGLYGSGDAAERIVKLMRDYLGGQTR